MSFPNPLYDPSRRRRPGARRYNHTPQQSHRHRHSPLANLATAAAVAYGAYRLGEWAWNAYFIGNDDDDKINEEEVNEDGDILNEWTDDYRAVERDIRREEGFPNVFDDETTDGEGDSTPNKSKSIVDDDDHQGGRRSKKPPVRSRRSRGDWNARHLRSNSPSPPQDHHHHHRGGRHPREAKGGENTRDGTAIPGAKKAAEASGGVGAAVSAGITAGINAYNRRGAGDDVRAPSANDRERQLRLGRCRLETSRAMMDFLPTLKKAVAKETDVGAETEGLKGLRIRKKEISESKRGEGDAGVDRNIIGEDEEEAVREEERRLWNAVKNKSIARLVTTVYAHTIVFLVLTVQVNLLGGQLLQEEQQEEERQEHRPNSSTGADRYRKSHQTVLSKTYHHLFARGIPSLAESVEQTVTEILQNWDVLGDSATLRDVSAWMERIRDSVEQRHEKTGGPNPLLKFVIPPEGQAAAAAGGGTENAADGATDDELADYILDETYDLLESPAYANAQRRCLDATFDQLRTKVLGKLFLPQDDVPLAKVVTYLQKSAVTTFHKPPSHREEMESWGGVLGMMEEPLPSVPNAYISKLERLEDVMELADVCF